MAGPAILKIDIIADATKALKAMGLVEDKAKGGMGMTGLGKAVVGAVGTGAILKFGKDSFNAAEDAAVSSARLEQVFASMGDTTGEAARSAEDYASALSAKIGVDDDAIMAAQAQLATFGAVSDETARAAGIFDRTTAAAADLAAAGFGSLDSNSISLGKALQDPAKGITALAKSGVTFTDQQKAQIKAMQDSGDLLGAQKLVLGAVEKQVKGTAAATATSTDKMSVAYGEVQESIGAGLLPVMEALAPVVQNLSKFFQDNVSWLVPLIGVILGVVAAVKVWTAVQTILNVVLSANPLGLVVIAIAALVAAVIIAYQKVGWFRDFVDAAWDAVVRSFQVLKDAAVDVFNWIKNNWPLLLAILTGPIGTAVYLIIRNWDSIKEAATALWQWVSDKFAGIGDAANAVYETVKGAFNKMVDFIRGLIDDISGIATRIGNALKAPINAFIRGWNAIEMRIPSVDIPLVGKVGGQTIGLPNIPTLAAGGMVARTGLALVHEGERFSGVGRGFGQTTINVNVTAAGLGADSPEIQRAVVNALRGYVARNGALDVPVRTA
jgi:phage-related protein